MEHLTKAQIVLLTLFVSFVASMATGIVVVTLMQQASEPVNQTITNVVERTIEKITPTFIEKPGQQIIIKDEDLVVSAVEKNSKSTVSLRFTNDAGEKVQAGVGTIISADGRIVTDQKNFNNGTLTTSVGGVSYTVEVIPNTKDGALTLGRLVPIVVSSSTPTFISATLSNSRGVKVGQTALILGGRDAKTVALGIVTSLETHVVTDKDTKAETTVLDGIVLSQRLAGLSNGAPIITLDGKVVGFVSLDETISSQKGVPVSEALSLIEEADKPIPAKKN